MGQRIMFAANGPQPAWGHTGSGGKNGESSKESKDTAKDSKSSSKKSDAALHHPARHVRSLLIVSSVMVLQ
jgi:hypothetical protein